MKYTEIESNLLGMMIEDKIEIKEEEMKKLIEQREKYIYHFDYDINDYSMWLNEFSSCSNCLNALYKLYHDLHESVLKKSIIEG